MKDKILASMKRLCIISGHYGSGKTSLAANLAILLAQHGRQVTVVDMDLVNPYFRSADYSQTFSEYGVRLITPPFANSNLDIPALPPNLTEVIRDESRYLLIDVGGDDAGAVSLGQLSGEIRKRDYDLCYVMNFFRYLTQTPVQTIQVLREIESACRLRATRLIHNSNLGSDTGIDDINNVQPLAEETAKLAGLPVWFTAVPEWITNQEQIGFPVTIFQKE